MYTDKKLNKITLEQIVERLKRRLARYNANRAVIKITIDNGNIDKEHRATLIKISLFSGSIEKYSTSYYEISKDKILKDVTTKISVEPYECISTAHKLVELIKSKNIKHVDINIENTFSI